MTYVKQTIYRLSDRTVKYEIYLQTKNSVKVVNLFIKFRLKFIDVEGFFNFKCRKIISSVNNCEAGVGILYFAVR